MNINPSLLYRARINCHAARRCIYSVAIANSRDHERLFDLTTRSHVRYAEHVNADYFQFREWHPLLSNNREGCDPTLSPYERGITYNKIAWLEALSEYEWILYLDMDVWISPIAKNIFNYSGLASENTPLFAAVNEYEIAPEERSRLMAEFALYAGGKPWSNRVYFNTGVFLVNKRLASMITTPRHLYTGTFFEQTWINWYVMRVIGCETVEIDPRYNAFPFRHVGDSARDAYFVHFAGYAHMLGGELERCFAMAHMIKRWFSPELNASELYILNSIILAYLSLLLSNLRRGRPCSLDGVHDISPADSEKVLGKLPIILQKLKKMRDTTVA